MIFGAIASAVIGGVLSNRAAKKERANSIEDARLQLSRLRESAETAGFNPLTALQNGGAGIGGNISSGVAPLASQSVISNVVEGVSDHFTGKAARDKSIEDMQHEIMKIELEKSKAGGAYPAVQSTWNASRIPRVAGTAGLGKNPSYATTTTQFPKPGASELGSTSTYAPDREVEIAPYSSGPGVTELSSSMTGNEQIVVPGADGEPWGIDEVATAFIFGAPQVLVQKWKGYFENRDKTKADELMNQWFKSQKASDLRQHNGWGKSPPRGIAPTQSEIDKYRFRNNALKGLK